MKNSVLKNLAYGALVVAMFAAFGQLNTLAQDLDGSGGRHARQLEGTWVADITFRNCQTGDPIRTFAAMSTYMRGGTMIESGLGQVPLTRTAGHGIWDHDTGRHFTASFRFFRFNADGTYGGFNIVRKEVELDSIGSSYSATWVAQGFNTAGVLVGTACATEAATQFE